MFASNNNRFSTPNTASPRYFADHGRFPETLEDPAALQPPTAAFPGPVSSNGLFKVLNPKHPNSEKDPTSLTAPLHNAVRYGDAVGTKWVLDAGADPNARDQETGRSALEAASLAAQYPVKIADLLYQHGADVNQADEEGWSLLHYATFRGKVKELKWLLEHGASIEVRTKVKRTISGATLDFVTPLQIAASSKHFHALACLDELLKAGAKTDPTAGKGYTAIHLAARGGSCPAVAMLLTAGARLDHSNNPTRTTPLQEAIAHQQLDVLRYLLCLESGCVYRKNRSYYPYLLAEERKQVEDVLQGPPTQESSREEIWKLVKDVSGNALYRYRINNKPRFIGVGPISYVPKSARRFNCGEDNDRNPSNLRLRRETDDRRAFFEFGGISTMSVSSSSASSGVSEPQLEWSRSSPRILQQTQDSNSDLSEDVPPKHPIDQHQDAPDSTPFDGKQHMSMQEPSDVEGDHCSTAKSASIDTFPPITTAVVEKHDETPSQWKSGFCEPESFEPSYQHAPIQQSQEKSSDSPIFLLCLNSYRISYITDNDISYITDNDISYITDNDIA